MPHKVAIPDNRLEGTKAATNNSNGATYEQETQTMSYTSQIIHLNFTLVTPVSSHFAIVS